MTDGYGIRRMSLISLVGFATACGLLPFDREPSPLQRADAGGPDQGGFDAMPSAPVEAAEDERPISGLDASTLLAMKRGEADGRPCGLRRLQDKVLVNRFGWTSDGQLHIFDYVFVDGPGGLESRAVRFYDERGRLTDEVFVEGTLGSIEYRVWYQWEGDLLVRRFADDGLALATGPVKVEEASWSVGAATYDYDPIALTLIERDPRLPHDRVEYTLSRTVTADEVIGADGIFRTFDLLGPIVQSVAYDEAFDDLTRMTTEISETTVYERDEQGRVTRIGEDSELIYDCSTYD